MNSREKLADKIDNADVMFIRNCPMFTKFDHENVDTLLSGEEQNIIVAALRADHAQSPLWQSGDILPPVKFGHMKEFVIAVYREQSKKVYSFACSYLNAHRLQYEWCPKDAKKDGFCDGCDDGCPTTGWFILTGDGDNESGAFNSLTINDGDKIVGWQNIPQWDGTPVTSTDRGDAK